MNKQELHSAVAELLETSRADAGRSVDAVLHVIQREVARGGAVAIAGFGKFEPVTRPARTARNPQTGTSVELPETTVPKFRAGATFKAVVAGTVAPFTAGGAGAGE